MRKLIASTLMLLISVASFAQKLPPEIAGVWKCDDFKIEIFKSGQTYSAKLLWAKDIFEADGKTPKRDSKNPDEKLRNRSRQGITHITELIYKDGEFINGKLYSVQDGNTYSFEERE